jgi:hypothetical protein
LPTAGCTQNSGVRCPDGCNGTKGVGRDLRDGSGLQERRQPEGRIELFAEVGHQPDRLQRVTAKVVGEMVEHSDRLDAEDLFPKLRHREFQPIARRGGLCSRS